MNGILVQFGKKVKKNKQKSQTGRTNETSNVRMT
jgi:hypothetical protein